MIGRMPARLGRIAPRISLSRFRVIDCSTSHQRRTLVLALAGSGLDNGPGLQCVSLMNPET